MSENGFNARTGKAKSVPGMKQSLLYRNKSSEKQCHLLESKRTNLETKWRKRGAFGQKY